MDLDTSKWSGEGAFTQVVVDSLRQIDKVQQVRVEDAPASRSDADYNFVSNEIYVTFATTTKKEPARLFGIFKTTRDVSVKVMTVSELETALAGIEGIGEADYADEVMLQYLRTERIIPPYQTRGYKIVELVRIYEVQAGQGPDPTA